MVRGKEMKPRTLRAALLIAGTSIGGGMLALPVELAAGGFFPSLLIYLFCWAIMCLCGLLFLETNLWMKGEANIVSMARFTLGRFGEVFAWTLYIFQFYLLMVAYVSGCGKLLVAWFPVLSPVAASWLFCLFFAPVVWAGARVAGRINLFLMAGLFLSFFGFLYLGFSHIHLENLEPMDPWASLAGLPVAFTAFAYQGTVPTVVHYLEREVKECRKAIVLGSFLPLIAYFFWQLLILGIVPLSSLLQALAKGETAVYPLQFVLNTHLVYSVAKWFSFFALVTSLLGVGLGLVDFFADGLKIENKAKGRLALCLLVFLPPLLVTSINPCLFLSALELSGGFGCAILLGLLPVAMVFSGRRYLGLPRSGGFPFGNITLTFLAALLLFEVGCQIAKLSGVL
jgi:tyrosine-specific transport protein